MIPYALGHKAQPRKRGYSTTTLLVVFIAGYILAVVTCKNDLALVAVLIGALGITGIRALVHSPVVLVIVIASILLGMGVYGDYYSSIQLAQQASQ